MVGASADHSDPRTASVGDAPRASRPSRKTSVSASAGSMQVQTKSFNAKPLTPP